MLDVGLHLSGTFAQAVGIGGHGTQAHEIESLALYLLDDDGENVLLSLAVFGQEDQACSVVSLFRYWDSLQEDKLMWNLQHDSSSIASLAVCSLGTSVSHVLQHLERVVNQFMAFVSMDVDHHAYTAGVVLVVGAVKSLSLDSFFCHSYCCLLDVLIFCLLISVAKLQQNNGTNNKK